MREISDYRIIDHASDVIFIKSSQVIFEKNGKIFKIAEGLPGEDTHKTYNLKLKKVAAAH